MASALTVALTRSLCQAIISNKMANLGVRLPLRPDRREQFIFCDESGVFDRFFVLGSLTTEWSLNDLNGAVGAVKEAYALRDEIKWEKAPRKPGKFLEGYKAVVDAFLSMPVKFKALIVDTNKHPLNHPEFTGGSYGIGYFQFYLVLLFSGIIKHRPEWNSHICLHNPAYPLKGGFVRMEDKINEAARSARFTELEHHSCCRVSAHDAKPNNALQLADILTGMVSAVWNSKTACPTKLNFIQYCQGQLGVELALPSDNRHVEERFNRWLFRPDLDKEKSKKWPALYPPTN